MMEPWIHMEPSLKAPALSPATCQRRRRTRFLLRDLEGDPRVFEGLRDAERLALLDFFLPQHGHPSAGADGSEDTSDAGVEIQEFSRISRNPAS